MTTRAGEKHQQVAMGLGASGYLTKPVEERALVAAVEQCIGRAAGAAR
jgi:chemosensory pili system protein ChpA (sensor histidine kinase/response regulator)